MNKKVINILIEVGLYISFAYYYLINVWGGGYYDLMGLPIYATIIISGLVGLAIFELALLVLDRYFRRSIIGFQDKSNYFRHNIRLLIIARNIVLGSLNFLFMAYPIISIWGLMISYIVTTTVVGYIWLRLFVKKYKLGNNYGIYLDKMSKALCFYLIIYIIISGGVL